MYLIKTVNIDETRNNLLQECKNDKKSMIISIRFLPFQQTRGCHTWFVDIILKADIAQLHIDKTPPSALSQ